MIRPLRIVTGGQRGADQGALRAAKALGIQTGGVAPRGYKTEAGPAHFLKHVYGLTESWSPKYSTRTAQNVADAHATVLVGDLSAPGSLITWRLVVASGKPYIVNPTPYALAEWADYNTTILFGESLTPVPQLVLNVAGNRASGNPGIEEYVYALLVHAWDAAATIPTPVMMIPRLRDQTGAGPTYTPTVADLHRPFCPVVDGGKVTQP